MHRSSTLAHRDLTWQLGIRVTTPARTLFDNAPRLKQRTLTRAVKDALVRKYLTEDALAELLRRHPNAKATRLLTGFISNDAGLTRSELEELFPRFCERYGLPRPLMNVCVGGYLVTRTSPSTG